MCMCLLSGVSNALGRVSNSTNLVMGLSQNESQWRELDAQVHEYPALITFKAIGVGGNDFERAMTQCVESVIGKVHAECINSKLSSKSNYISVSFSVWVQNQDQKLQIYDKMKEDGRLKFYI
jgi:putative lipoic acid-binding regulatory protein